MSEPISLIFDTTVHEGKLDEAKQVAAAMHADVVKNEPGTLVYNCYIDEVSRRLCFTDRYASSEAFMAHLGNPVVGEALGKILAIADLNGLTILGEPSDEVRAAVTPMGAKFLAPYKTLEREPVTV